MSHLDKAKAIDRERKEDIYLTTALRVAKIVKDKNHSYGSAYAKSGDFLKLLYPGGIRTDQYTDALLLVRIFDKQMRIANRRGAFGENPYEDIMGYGLVGTIKELDIQGESS